MDGDNKVRKRVVVVIKQEFVESFSKKSKSLGENNYLSSQKQLADVGNFIEHNMND